MGICLIRASLVAQLVKNPPAMQEDPGSIPGSGRSTREGTGYPLQSSWASLVAQLVKESTCNAGDLGLISRWLPIPVFWPREFHGLYSP